MSQVERIKPGVYLVYQAGIANVFEVDDEGNRRRLLQHAFSPCEYFALGMANAGKIVRTMACNRAGDITDVEWSSDLENQPFSDKFRPVFNPAIKEVKRNGTL